jgi:hypothetical protein
MLPVILIDHRQLATGGRPGFGNHDLCYGNGSRHANDGRGKNMAHDAGNGISQNTVAYSTITVPAMVAIPAVIRVKQLTTRHFLEIWAYEQWGLHHAYKYVGRYTEAFSTSRNPSSFAKAPGKTLDDQRKDAPVEQQRRQSADHQNQRLAR